MPVIAMTREPGALGEEIATALAGELKLKVAHDDIAHGLAQKMRLAPEAVLRHLDGRSGRFARWRAERAGLALYAAEEVLRLAAAGDVVILGWGASHLLREVAHVLRVRVCAPLDLRARRLMQRGAHEDLESAAEELRRGDAAHDAAMRRRFALDWRDPSNYDLVLNTERVSAERCVAQIRRAIESRSFAPSAASRAQLSSLTLSAHIHSALRRDPATAQTRIRVEAGWHGRAGHVTLHGTVFDDEQRRAAGEVAWRLPGVCTVDNRVRPLWPRLAFRPSADG